MSSLQELIKNGIPDSLIECFVKRHRSYALFGREPDTMTDLQEDVFLGKHASEFWSGKDLFVQGQTSAGKTLIAEVAAARCFQTEPTKKVIYLVPYRAMVSEKYPVFLSSMHAIGKYEVFPSSSDYQNFDIAITNGNYDLLITVYEKLFAFLAMGNRMVLNNIGLIVIDELQLFSDPNRGPKIEMILAKIKNMDISRRPQIIGLTTPNYDCSLIAKHFSAAIVKNTKRSVELVEYFSDTNGNGAMQKTFVTGNIGDKEDEYSIPFVASKDLDSAIIHTVNHVIQPVASDTPELRESVKCKKILIFRSTRRKAMDTALDIAKRSQLHKMLSVEVLPNDLNENLEDDEYSQEIRNCVKVGVAFHHAGLSYLLRKCIEDEFRKEDGLIKVLVATETLSVGVNYPSDVVLVIDREIPSDGDFRALSGPEYRNYVGRAGRLGAHEYGESYMLYESAEMYKLYSPKYKNVKDVNVESALAKLAPDGKMPYILFWMTQNSGNIVDIDDLYEELTNNTLMFHIDDNEDTECKANEHKKAIRKSIEYMRRLHLVEQSSFNAERIGEILSGFALGRATINHINNDIKALLMREIDSEAFTLDFLYSLCQCAEIQKMSYMNLSNEEKDTTGSLKAYVNSEKFRKQYSISGLEQTNLYTDLYDEYTMPNSAKLLAAKRAIVLFLWMQGHEVEVIKKETTFSRLFFADIVRIADVASFITESICILSSQGWNVETAKREELLQKISKLLQYGVPQSVIFLASLHNYKLTRKKLVALSKSLDEYNETRFIKGERKLRILEYFLQQEEKIVKTEKRLTKTMYKEVVSDICRRYNGGRTTDGIDEVHMCIALDWDSRNHTQIGADVDAYYRKKDNYDIRDSIISLLRQPPFNCGCESFENTFVLELSYGSLKIAVDIRERIDNNGSIISVTDQIDVFICSTETFGRLVNEEILDFTLITKEGFMTLLLNCLNANAPAIALFQVLAERKPLPSKAISLLLANRNTEEPLRQKADYHIFATNDQYAAELVSKFEADLKKRNLSCETFITPAEDFIRRTAGVVCPDDFNAREIVFILFDNFESDSPLTSRLNIVIENSKISSKRSDRKKTLHTSIIYSDAITDDLRAYTKDITSEHGIDLKKIPEQNLREPSVQIKIIKEVNRLKRFKVAFSFPGDHRDKIKDIVNILIQKYSLTEDHILFDEFHKAEFSGPNLAPYLQKLYHDHSEVIVVLLCQEYQNKPWCFDIEWKAIYDSIIKRQGDVMYLSIGNPEIPGTYVSQDGIIYLEKETTEGCAKYIYDRINGKGRMDI